MIVFMPINRQMDRRAERKTDEWTYINVNEWMDGQTWILQPTAVHQSCIFQSKIRNCFCDHYAKHRGSKSMSKPTPDNALHEVGVNEISLTPCSQGEEINPRRLNGNRR